MTWVRLDDRYPEHPKVDKVGPHAAWLNVCAWAYCARNMTDGFVPAERVDRLATVPNPRKLVAALVAVNLWEKVEGGYRVHDFLDYNPSREQVLAERARNADRVSRHRNGVSNDVSNAITSPITPPVTAPINNGVSTGAPYPARPGPLRRETNNPSVAIATSSLREAAARVVFGFEHHTWLMTARELQAEVIEYLEKTGWICQREFPVRDRGDGRAGRVDVVAERGELKLGIEIDAVSPRDKSAYKLAQVPDAIKVILLRGDRREVDPAALGVDFVGFLPNAKETSPPAGKAARRTIVDDEFRESLVSEYASAFGSRASVQSVIDEALSHKALAKRTDHRAYLRNWVRRDAEAAVRRREGFKATLSVVDAAELECSCEEIRQSDARGERNMPRLCELHGFRPPPVRRGPNVVGISPEVIQKCSECGSDGAYGQIRGRRLCTNCATRSEVREEAHA